VYHHMNADRKKDNELKKITKQKGIKVW
jgi:hypothetical protein